MLALKDIIYDLFLQGGQLCQTPDAFKKSSCDAEANDKSLYHNIIKLIQQLIYNMEYIYI